MQVKNNVYRRGLVIGIILLFIGSGVLPSSIGVNGKKNVLLENTSKGYIQGLIDNASAGDIVYIPSGIYNENIIINKSISLVGEDMNTTIIDGGENGYVISISANWVNVSRFTIRNGGKGAAIIIEADNCTIIDNNVSNNYNGIKISSDSNNNGIIGNTISNKGHGIWLYESNLTNISGNKINANQNYGIEIEDSDSNIITGNIILDNLDGIYLWYNSDNNTINGNTISDNHIGISSKGIYNIIISNNISSNNVGIDAYGMDYNIISGNIITLTKSEGIHMGLADYNQITDNIFFNSGFYVFRSFNNTVQNNIVNGKPLVYLEDKSNDIITNAGQVICINCDNVTIENQILTNTYIGVELWESTNCHISNNDCSNNNFGIYLSHYSNNNTIIENTIANNDNGIYLNIDCNYNLIEGNTISYNKLSGIELIGCKYNTIKRNQISYNSIGITLKPYIGWWYYTDSERNTIYKNNFLHNILHATFHYTSKEFSSNIWSRNYWRKLKLLPKLLPKLILGKIGISNELPGIDIDWRPKRIPNYIGKCVRI